MAHAIAQSLTAVPAAHANYLHGEHVAIGTLVQLMMETDQDAKRVAEFFARIGLPIHLGQMSMAPDDKSAIDIIVDSTMSWPTSHNMPMPVTPESIRLAIDNAHELGLQVAQSSGDEAYRRLHS